MAHSPSPPPPLHAYWFYTSSLPIDDPLSPLPALSQSTAKQPPRPFSRYDSTALENAYGDLLRDHQAKSQDRKLQKPVSRPHSPIPGRHLNAVNVWEAALEGHPAWDPDNSDLLLQDGILPSTAPGEVSPMERRTQKRSESPRRSMLLPSSAPTNAVNYTAGTETTAANTTPTRNPFIRSLSQSRKSSPNVSARSSLVGGAKVPPSPTSPPKQREIPVGIQRLHKVLLPSFIMTPIYWSPLHDVASVVRGTWFYKDTLLPVETDIANRLEAGWEEVHAWTEEWDMELASAVEVGREGEEKVRWKLWDTSNLSAASSRPGSSTGLNSGEMIQPPTTPTVPGTANTTDAPSRAKPNEWDWVLFANGTDAYICRDSMLSFGNKRPLANIRRGKTVGTHVVRGFSEKEWLRLHPPRRKPPPASTAKGRSVSVTATPPLPVGLKEKPLRSYSATYVTQPPPSRTAESEFQTERDVGVLEQHQEEGLGLGETDAQRGNVTDLFLVIHGIGQKLSERVESFHFTHSINSFRRLLNVELRNEAVKPHLRDNVGIMVLPINWRHNLSFEGIEETSSEEPGENMYSLNDITPPSIPAVRNLIGDVMLDIPYYLSHHKQKMVKAVTAEANRVYRLWCKNNPRFEKEGKVHIIAHSLGTALAMDILSKQPTRTVYEPNPPSSSGSGWGKRRSRESSVQDERFDFDTANIFFCGSPAGFFLLLNRSMLLPRKGRNKRGFFGEDSEPGVAGEAGKYGCMAVDNVYNIMHYSDPIAYRLNPTVDPEYAATLKIAYVPSTSNTFLDAISSTLRSVLPGTSPDNASLFNNPQSLTMPRLPSNIELETHDFSREELAEKRLFLLNDNGQLDWYLSVQRPLENQYLNMLGAHSSYWESRDFARMLVVEVGRESGRGKAVRGMRVQKKRGFLGR